MQEILASGIEHTEADRVDHAWFHVLDNGVMSYRVIVLLELASLPQIDKREFSFLNN